MVGNKRRLDLCVCVKEKKQDPPIKVDPAYRLALRTDHDSLARLILFLSLVIVVLISVSRKACLSL